MSSSNTVSPSCDRFGDRSPRSGFFSSPGSCSNPRVSARMPSLPAIARAVSAWSPVTITTRTDAACARFTAVFTPAFGGSSIPNRPASCSSSPTKPSRLSTPAIAIAHCFSFVSSPSRFASAPGLFAAAVCAARNLGRSGMTISATAITRFPSAISPRHSPSTLPPTGDFSRSNTRSGAPFTMSKPRRFGPPGNSCAVTMYLFAELNGISNTFWCDRSDWLYTENRSAALKFTALAKKMAFSVGEPLIASLFTAPAASSGRVESALLDADFDDTSTVVFSTPARNTLSSSSALA
mmetsp:Transcript_25532/g.64358  ORF Transcript_25532/g.64358 Transcript_25532/m.64358 type:complete len:294 (+) Transcript_25532:1141-2022(+)